MGMTEKQSLINSLTIQLAEDYNLNIKELKAKITETLQNYHVTINENEVLNGNLETDYLMQKFYDGKTAAGMTEKTLIQYKIAINLLEKHAEKKLADIEAEDVNKFLKEYGKTVSDVTVRGKYQYLSSVYNWLFTHKYISFNPILYVDVPKATVIYKEQLTDLDFEKIKNACEKLPEKESIRNMALIYFFTSTGCRVSELSNIKLSDIDFDKKVCKVIGKGKKERPVVLNDKTIYRLKLYLSYRKNLKPTAPLFARLRGEEASISSAGIERVISKLGKSAGVYNVTCHSFRRYYATELRKRNVNIQMIASSLGHANLNQINRYSLYNSSELISTVRSAL